MLTDKAVQTFYILEITDKPEVTCVTSSRDEFQSSEKSLWQPPEPLTSIQIDPDFLSQAYLFYHRAMFKDFLGP